jgi:hypothetical protein
MTLIHPFARGIVPLLIAAVVSSCSSATTGTGTAAPPRPNPVRPIPDRAPTTGAPTYQKEFGTMWTFEAPPLEYWKTTYNFTPDQAWLDHVRLASIRLPNCSASFVSANGLVMTNHHCGRACTAAVSPADTDYMATGFAAATLADEKKCSMLWVDQLVSFQNVTDRVQRAVTGSSAAEQTAQRTSAIGQIEQECQQQTNLTCQVITLYNGGMYSLYRFKRYTDLRLVMAPEEGIAFFGGDPDNFTFPRYDLDLTLLRVYENDKPVQVKDYLKWSKAGAAENELVFVTGNPGSTGRLNTLAQMEYLRDVQYPATIASFDRQIAALQKLAEKHGHRNYDNAIFGLQNSRKATIGYRAGLLDSAIMARKRAFEADFRARVNADPALRSQYGDAWDEITRAQSELATLAPRLRNQIFGYQQPQSTSRLLSMAAQLVRIPVETPKPEEQRISAYREPNLTQMKAAITGNTPIRPEDEKITLAILLSAIEEELPADDPVRTAALQGKTAAQAADYLVSNTKLTDPAFRKTLLDGGAAAIASSTDPMIVLARTIDPYQRGNTAKQDSINAVLNANVAKLGQAIFAVYGTALPPDATFSLRITDGVVKGFPMNGTIAPFKTSFYGLFARNSEFDNKDPFTLPQRWATRRDRLDLATPFNFVSTNDIIGGNSGSPVLNRAGEIVGLIFDGNIESLPNRFIFTDEVARSVSVHSRGIIEALRKVYDLNRIADELEGK